MNGRINNRLSIFHQIASWNPKIVLAQFDTFELFAWSSGDLGAWEKAKICPMFNDSQLEIVVSTFSPCQ